MRGKKGEKGSFVVESRGSELYGRCISLLLFRITEYMDEHQQGVTIA